MARRDSSHDSRQLADLAGLGKIVGAERLSKRDEVEQSRRTRHDEKQFSQNALTVRLNDGAGGVPDGAGRQ